MKTRAPSWVGRSNITPVDLANEIYDILRKRLFTSLPDKAVIGDIAASYGRKLEEASKSKVAIAVPKPLRTKSPPPIRSIRA